MINSGEESLVFQQPARIASEVAVLVGGPVIFYALLEKVHSECEETKVTERVFDFVASSKKLREAA